MNLAQQGYPDTFSSYMRNLLLLALLGAGLLTGYRAVGQTCFTPFLATGRAMVDGTCYQMTWQGEGFSVGDIWADRTINLTQDFDFTLEEAEQQMPFVLRSFTDLAAARAWACGG